MLVYSRVNSKTSIIFDADFPIKSEVKINETDIGDGDSSDDGVEFDEAHDVTGDIFKGI